MKYLPQVSNVFQLETVCAVNCSVSISYLAFKNKAHIIKDYVQRGYDIFLNPGCFTSENKTTVGLVMYLNFIKETGIKHYTTGGIIQNYYENYSDFKPIPVFDIHSSLNQIETVLKNPEIKEIALYGFGESENSIKFLDKIFAYLIRNKKYIKVHGFGIRKASILKRYPWFSFDNDQYKNAYYQYNGFCFLNESEEEYTAFLNKIGYNFRNTDKMDFKLQKFEKRRFRQASMFNLSQSYRNLAASLKEINKTKDFSYLTAIEELFPDND